VAEERNAVDDSVTEDTGEIREEIARTRNEMGETLGEIQERLTPDRLMQQAKETVQEAAREKTREVMRSAAETAQVVAETTQESAGWAMSYMRAHPMSAIMLGIGATWLIARRRRTTDDYGHYYGGSMDTYGRRYDDEGYEIDESVSGGTEANGERVATRVGRVASKATSAVRDVATSTTSQVSRGFHRAESSLGHWVQENPLAVGAAAIALGVAVGLTVRRTAVEDRAFGGARDQVMRQAGDVARDLRATVSEKLQNVAESAIGEVKTSYDSARSRM
jgi:ElaB/YqjD/DUF883 family membrane-anchored ribosome-binding protein